MEKIDLKELCTCIVQIAPKAPITPLNEDVMIFRGERLELQGNKAHTRKYEFSFNSLDEFIEGMRTYGLMLNHREITKVLELYGKGIKQWTD